VMEGRVSRGSGKRGGRGGKDSDSFGGERRGRGGHYRGRGKRDHHRGRGRGRGGGAHAAEFHHWGQDERDSYQEEDDKTEVFSRRKLESNWDRYEESERPEPDDDTPTQRGTDYRVLLESAGDSFTHFRFSEEKEWETYQLDIRMVLDLPGLAHILQEVPLHQRLNLEAELVQVGSLTASRTVLFGAQHAAVGSLKSLSSNKKVPMAANPVRGSGSQPSSAAAEPLVDDADEELDELLSLQKPASGVGENQSVSGADMESTVTEKEKMEEVKDKDVAPPQPAPVKQEITEEDLEDWLDSMIS
uniref:Apoptosis, caspase activation inhibitor n=1 Tax=Amphilophus citrinellus TaxID=61819 RepID=A0A3Q0RVQ2_AMPCI